MSATSAKPRILVVEDFEDSRCVLRQLLEIEGFQILEASDGRPAVEVALGEAPDLVLMDLSLPSRDGFQATREIRALAGYQSPPIIIVSAYDTSEIRAEAEAAGCADYLTKPIDFAQLERLIAKYLAATQAPGHQAASID